MGRSTNCNPACWPTEIFVPGLPARLAFFSKNASESFAPPRYWTRAAENFLLSGPSHPIENCRWAELRESVCSIVESENLHGIDTVKAPSVESALAQPNSSNVPA